jgi:hypothetical protein
MTSKDWTGNNKTAFSILGASNHSECEREERDFYATHESTLEVFLEALERDKFKLNKYIWEPAAGEKNLSYLLERKGYVVYSSDIIERDVKLDKVVDFFDTQGLPFEHCDILSNPPYKEAKAFVEHSLELLKDGSKCIMFLKIQFLEGLDRRKMFEKYPPRYVYVNSKRQKCAINNDFTKFDSSSAFCYCWFIWEKGWKGDPIIRWI